MEIIRWEIEIRVQYLCVARGALLPLSVVNMWNMIKGKRKTVIGKSKGRKKWRKKKKKQASSKRKEKNNENVT